MAEETESITLQGLSKVEAADLAQKLQAKLSIDEKQADREELPEPITLACLFVGGVLAGSLLSSRLVLQLMQEKRGFEFEEVVVDESPGGKKVTRVRRIRVTDQKPSAQTVEALKNMPGVDPKSWGESLSAFLKTFVGGAN